MHIFEIYPSSTLWGKGQKIGSYLSKLEVYNSDIFASLYYIYERIQLKYRCPEIK